MLLNAISKLFNFFNKYTKTKNLKKIESNTVKSLTRILNFFKKIDRYSKWKPVPFGISAFSVSKNIKCKSEIFYLEKERLKIKLLLCDNYKNNNEDFIIFLHGTARDHTQWLNKKGFGDQYFSIFPKDKILPVVCVSFGMSYIIKNRLPFPFEVDLESIFIYKILPYLRERIDKNGIIHLIGHSIGAFNALNLIFKYPNIFKSVIAISPFIVSKSPFLENFEYYKSALLENPLWSYFIKYNLMYAFKDKNDWIENNPINLLDKIDKNFSSKIIITEAITELEGFRENIEFFLKKMREKNITFNYYFVKGDHHNSDITEAFKNFYNIIYGL